MDKTLPSRKLNRLIVAIQELSVARELNRVMEIVCIVSRELTGADGATFVLREGEYCFYADEASIAPLFKGHHFPIQKCISGWVMLNKKHALVTDIYQDDRIPHEIYRSTFVKSLLMVPIRTMDPIGAIGNYWAEKHEPSPEEISALQLLADATATAFENIRVYSELGQRVKQCTLELEEMNKELENFSYSISHDLRAPLRAINGFLEILIEDHSKDWSEDAKKLVRRVHVNAQDMSGLINSLLGFFKMGKSELEKVPVNMEELVLEICTNLKDQEKDRDIRISIKDLPAASADGALIKQVWQNLISNAVKYTGNKPQALIEIGAQTTNNKVSYYVKDNGAGFDMSYSNKLFGMFQRLHSQREFEGTGIGLATVDKIVKRHGGKVWADAKVNEGATFYFTLN